MHSTNHKHCSCNINMSCNTVLQCFLQVVVCSPEFDTYLLQLLEAAGYIATSIPDPTLLTAAAAAQQQQAMPKGRGSSARVRSQQQQQQQQELPHHVSDLLLVHCCKQQQQCEVLQLQQVTAACF